MLCWCQTLETALIRSVGDIVYLRKNWERLILVCVFWLDEEIELGDINSVFEGYSLYRNFENSIAYLARMLFSAFEIWIWNNTYKAGVFELSACVSIAVCPFISLKYWSLLHMFGCAVGQRSHALLSRGPFTAKMRS